ncbi:MAG: ABC transporter permease [Lachnospiraceae bacterium]|nr:ABC transporter permease [Lachnospiraceae bacterium]
MNRVLRKRFPRQIKADFFRLGSLFLMIALCMYIVIALVDAAEVVIRGTIRNQAESRLEDGQFTVFNALSKEQLSTIEEKGVTIEPHISYDMTLDDGSVIRIFRDRKLIDTVVLDTGRNAEKANEIVLEKRYCEEHGIKTGDGILIGDERILVTGIGSTVDYDAPLKKLSDTAVDSTVFGTGFVTAEGYEYLKSIAKTGAEDLTYAFLLNDSLSADELKQMIRGFEFDYKSVDDPYYREMLEDTYGKKDEIRDGIDDLVDGAKELRNGAKELRDGAGELRDGTGELYDGAQELYDGTSELAEGLGELSDGSGKLKDGLNRFGSSLSMIPGMSDGMSPLTAGMNGLDSGIREASEGSGKLHEGARELLDGADELYGGTEELRDGTEELLDGTEEMYDGVLELREKSDELIDRIFTESPDNLTAFLLKEDNLRVGGASGDIEINKTVGMVAGIVVIILFTYVLSVFVIHQIQEESSTIGALYALGVRKKDLMRHYIFMPTMISFLGGVAGAAFGLSGLGSSWQMSDSYNYYSLPAFDRIIPPYLIVYAVIMPPAVSVIVNFLVINRSLSRTALSLIRNVQKAAKGRDIPLPDMPFMKKFKLRQMLRERRIALTVTIGMVVSLLIFMLGLNCYVLCRAVGERSSEDTRYEYMYTFKYPSKEVPEGGEACYIRTLKKESFGYTLDVTVMGIDEDNPYIPVTPVKGKNKVVISDAVAQKYGLGTGDKLILTDNAEDLDYAFTVEKVVPYCVGLTVFMDIESCRELFGEENDYYNTVMADRKLDIEEGRLYSVTTKADVDKASGVFLELMAPLFSLLMIMSTVVFCLVIYLMTSVMIDRASFGISLVKIFGFRGKEVKKLYLDGNRTVIMTGALIGIPLAKLITDRMFPMFVANVACGIPLVFRWYYYPAIFLAITVVYSIVSLLLTGKLNRMTPAQVLKNRE